MSLFKHSKHFLLRLIHEFLFSFSPADPPLITLEFGTNPVVEGNIVSEGADVYFECNIKANPWVYRVAWRHNVRRFPGISSAHRIKNLTLNPFTLSRRITTMSFRTTLGKESSSQISLYCFRTSHGIGGFLRGNWNPRPWSKNVFFLQLDWASTSAPQATPKATDSVNLFSLTCSVGSSFAINHVLM